MNTLEILKIQYAMGTRRRTFTEDQKRDILKEAEQNGIIQTIRHYELSYSVFSKWKQKFRNPGSSAKTNIDPKIKNELKNLIEENVRLKNIIAHQALELERKNEELKKNILQLGKK